MKYWSNIRKIVVHINRFQPVDVTNVRDSKPRPRYKITRKHSVSSQESEQVPAIKIGVRPLAHKISREDSTQANREVSLPQLHNFDSSPTRQDMDTPTAERVDPTFRPGDPLHPEGTCRIQASTRSSLGLRVRSIRNEHASPE